MAVPKRRQSKARRDSRRAQWMKIPVPAAAPCPNCAAARMPHRVCDSCGWYGSAKEGRVVVQPKVKSSAQNTSENP
jgi:large subunit ribosomal protein L32